MQLKMWTALIPIIVVVVVALAGCGVFTGDVDPPDPATCECAELRDYVAGLPMIG